MFVCCYIKTKEFEMTIINKESRINKNLPIKSLLQLTMLMTFCLTGLAHTYAEQVIETTRPFALEQVDAKLAKIGAPEILYDRVVPLAELNMFNDAIENTEARNLVGVTEFGTNTASVGLFEQALSEMYKASNKTLFMSHKELRQTMSSSEQHNVVDIGVLNAEFQILSYFPEYPQYSGVSLSKDGSFYQKKGQQPYLDQHVLMISPLKRSVAGEEITFKFNQDKWFESGKRIVSLKADFGPHGIFTIAQNGSLVTQNVNIKYLRSGYQTIVFSAIFDDNSRLLTKGRLYVKVPTRLRVVKPFGRTTAATTSPDDCRTAPDNDLPRLTASIPFQGYEENSEIFGEIEYCIFYHTDDGDNVTTLKKPLLVLDGFDPGDVRKIRDRDFMENPDDHTSMEEFLSYLNPATGTPASILTELNQEGFDVIMINHPTYERNGTYIDGGADYIERNAMNLIKMIQTTNERLMTVGSTESIAIAGPSMGGQISRYALAYMEKHNMPHNVSLWASIDSPHLGANIPIGIQSLLNQTADISTAAEDFVDNWLGSAAAKQQLIDQFDHENNQINPGYLNGQIVEQGFPITRGAPFYTEYYENLFRNGVSESNGYPTFTRKVALVNGSMQGNTEYTDLMNPSFEGAFSEASDYLLNIRGFYRVRINLLIGSIVFRVHVASAESYAMPNTGDIKKISRFKLLFDDASRYMYNESIRGNVDSTPGGTFPGSAILVSELDGLDLGYDFEIEFHGLLGLISSPLVAILGISGNVELQLRQFNPFQSFIPTFSAIGHTNPNQSWSNPLRRNLVCSGETPFDSYFAFSVNTIHTSFSQASKDWMIAELNGDEQAPVYPLARNILNGPSTICYAGTEVTYSLGQCLAPGSATWSTSNYLQINSSTDETVGISASGSPSAYGSVTASFANGLHVSKDIWIGRPGMPSSLNGPTRVNNGALVNYWGGTSVGATSYRWYLPHPYQVVSQFDYDGPNWQMRPTTGRSLQAFTGFVTNDGSIQHLNSGYVQYMGVNQCGASGAKRLYVQHASEGEIGEGGIP